MMTGIEETVYTCVGDSLRAIATYSGDEYEVLYLRDDVATEYSADKREEIREHVVLEGIQEPFVESLFNDRTRQCQISVFEDILILHFNIDDESGYLISTDIDGFEKLDTFVTECRAIQSPTDKVES